MSCQVVHQKQDHKWECDQNGPGDHKQRKIEWEIELRRAKGKSSQWDIQEKVEIEGKASVQIPEIEHPRQFWAEEIERDFKAVSLLQLQADISKEEEVDDIIHWE